jgi:hypothetical protein
MKPKTQEMTESKSLQQLLAEEPYFTYPDKLKCIKIAATLPNKTRQELFDNADAIREYLKERWFID